MYYNILCYSINIKNLILIGFIYSLPDYSWIISSLDVSAASRSDSLDVSESSRPDSYYDQTH